MDGSVTRAHHTQLKRFHEIPTYLRRDTSPKFQRTLVTPYIEPDIEGSYSTDDESSFEDALETAVRTAGGVQIENLGISNTGSKKNPDPPACSS